MKSPTKESYTMLKGVRTETKFQFTNSSEQFQLNRSLSRHSISFGLRSGLSLGLSPVIIPFFVFVILLLTFLYAYCLVPSVLWSSNSTVKFLYVVLINNSFKETRNWGNNAAPNHDTLSNILHILMWSAPFFPNHFLVHVMIHDHVP